MMVGFEERKSKIIISASINEPKIYIYKKEIIIIT